MSIHIITDSASDIPQNFSDRIHVIPMAIRFGEEEFLDNINISHKEFFEKLVESDTLPTTSQITPFTFGEKIKEVLALEGCDQVIIITMSSALSGTYESACLAANEFESQVRVIDSLSVTVGERILVDYALILADEGKSIDEITEIIYSRRKDVHIIALLDTLEYLKKGGRISSAVAFTGELLSLKPAVTVEEGKVVLLGTARGSKHANNYIAQKINAVGKVDFSLPYYLGYTGLSDKLLQKYINDSKGFWENETSELPIMTIGGTIGTHVGPGAIAVAFFAEQA